MDSNRLADANHSAEQMLVLSVVFLVAAAMLIVSHLFGARSKVHATKPVETATPPDAQPVLVGATPLSHAPAAAPVVAAASIKVAGPAPERV
jgi:hypothetical protein